MKEPWKLQDISLTFAGSIYSKSLIHAFYSEPYNYTLVILDEETEQ